MDAAVWAYYERLIARIGPRPTLIERDGNVPAFAALMQERMQAAAVLEQHVASATASTWRHQTTSTPCQTAAT